MPNQWGRGTYGQNDTLGGILAEMAERARLREVQQQQEAAAQQRMQHEKALNDREIQARLYGELIRNADDPRAWEIAKMQGVPLPDFRQLPTEEARDVSARAGIKYLNDPTQWSPGFEAANAFQTGTGASMPEHVQRASITQDTYTRPNVPSQMVEAADIAGGRKMSAAQADKAKLNASRTAAQNTASYASAAASRARASGGATGATASGATRPVGGAGSAPSSNDVTAVADAIVNGIQAPETKGLYRNTLAVRAELSRRGYDLAKAQQDWYATQRYLSTMNGPQITRLRQATEFTYHSLDLLDELNKEWDGGGFPALNKGQLVAAQQGLLGEKAQSIATRLESQIADMVAELAVVYRGGGASTDEALKLAAENLKSSWGRKTLSANIAQIRKNLDIRRNSLKLTGVIANTGNRYEPNTGASGASGTQPQTFTPAQEAGIAAAMKASGKTRDEVIAYLRANGKL